MTQMFVGIGLVLALFATVTVLIWRAHKAGITQARLDRLEAERKANVRIVKTQGRAIANSDQLLDELSDGKRKL
jgi:hypothetical protein